VHRVEMICLAVLGVTGIALSGCGDSGAQTAQQWIRAQQEHLLLPVVEPVPAIVDIPPAVYRGKSTDPFSPNRVGAGAASSGNQHRTDVLFPNVPLSGLSVVGYLSGENRAPVAMIRYGTQYQSVRLGDRLGDREALVQQIGAQGVLVNISGSPEQWLPINKP
jgi:Tfp pilus assembly protein PilP